MESVCGGVRTLAQHARSIAAPTFETEGADSQQCRFLVGI
ncbi:hypothetical protein APS_1102 [Acetobacter pasteurianus subsp. pasteurianus LMG 1262 = NBRC 106471]|nr:hypothetical protein APS_1102 [Acetobacter pasteurianus subsp. pasteurianus LMG 1262 = NBRC 106471]